MQITGTFKHRKVDLVREGFNVDALSDPVYIRDDAHKTFVRLTPAVHASILNKQLRF